MPLLYPFYGFYFLLRCCKRYLSVVSDFDIVAIFFLTDLTVSLCASTGMIDGTTNFYVLKLSVETLDLFLSLFIFSYFDLFVIFFAVSDVSDYDSVAGFDAFYDLLIFLLFLVYLMSVVLSFSALSLC